MGGRGPRRARRLAACVLALAVAAPCAGCSERIDALARLVGSRVTGEEYVSPRGQACLDAAEGLLDALETGDGDAIVGLFSPEVRASSDDLEGRADELVASCSGHVEYLDAHSVTMPQESERVDDGRRRVELSAGFSFALGGENYWCFMTLVSENDFDEAEVGVSTIIVWSEEAYSAMLYDARGAAWPEGTGLNLRLDYPLEWETRLVYDDPLRYEGGDVISDTAGVAAFLDEGERTVDDFEERFGRPCCVSWTGDGVVYYELPEEDGEPRYLRVSAATSDDPIYSAYVVGERDVVRKVWDDDGA
ncbi:DUF5104 domain-containing protein [Olsenella uli]|uniref:DUF5104 domain-containing protein n=1 Tax=Olsenella uli TaxID=133926 RepID=UPI00195B7203|nr:DUF5104 domain-containing protein [Olsenella uli]MBM6815905.1 DUF5104 domain-containing protein [Olsenella uli]